MFVDRFIYPRTTQGKNIQMLKIFKTCGTHVVLHWLFVTVDSLNAKVYVLAQKQFLKKNSN